MVVRDFDFICISRFPPEADPVLIVDSDAVLAAPMAPKWLQPVPGWNRQLVKISDSIDLIELAAGHRPNCPGACTSGGTSVAAVEKIFCTSIPKRPYHGSYYNSFWEARRDPRKRDGRILSSSAFGDSLMNEASRIVQRSSKVMGGTPVFAGTRVPIQTLLDYLEAGDRLDDFLDEFPTVTREKAVAFLELAKEAAVAQASTS